MRLKKVLATIFPKETTSKKKTYEIITHVEAVYSWNTFITEMYDSRDVASSIGGITSLVSGFVGGYAAV